MTLENEENKKLYSRMSLLREILTLKIILIIQWFQSACNKSFTA